MKLSLVTCFAIISVFYKNYADATICEPLSQFRIDCDICLCSKDGSTYSCSYDICPPKPLDEFPNANNYGLRKLSRRRHNQEIPYINDEIPPSEEQIDNELGENLNYNDIPPEPYLDAGLEEDMSSDLLNTLDFDDDESDPYDPLPVDYRYKRSFKLPKRKNPKK